MREKIGHDLLILPGVTAVIRDGDRFLLARQRDTARWSLVGGGVELDEQPRDAVIREVAEELGVVPEVVRVIGAYGGPELHSVLPNGDEVAYVTTAYECRLPRGPMVLEQEELHKVAWFTRPRSAS
ncbi:NUDIX domain-containing protein [Microbacterium paludicola]|uniref:NUDIX domain-containing protein n=1 Tax=Microbacterium paludicola TaxID=300019 RepID=UPI001D16AC89|nr:NUDIX domain-containing protein [Microbacterium paludicola]